MGRFSIFVHKDGWGYSNSVRSFLSAITSYQLDKRSHCHWFASCRKSHKQRRVRSRECASGFSCRLVSGVGRLTKIGAVLMSCDRIPPHLRDRTSSIRPLQELDFSLGNKRVSGSFLEMSITVGKGQKAKGKRQDGKEIRSFSYKKERIS